MQVFNMISAGAHIFLDEVRARTHARTHKHTVSLPWLETGPLYNQQHLQY